MTAAHTLIELKGVTKAFETAAGVTTILKQADFTIEKGSFTIIYGASGSGKSTLLNILMGLDAPTTGKVVYDGQDMYAQSADDLARFRAETRGIVQQSNYWVKSLTVVENVAMPLYFTGISRELAIQKAMTSLKLINMERHARSFPYVLSGGEQQRVAMARALVHDPSYILADEPTGNLDSKNGDLIIDLLREFNQNGRTIILVTHNLEYLPIGTKLLLIQDGIVSQTEGSDSRKFTHNLIEQMKKRIDKWSDTNGESLHA